MGDLKRLQNMIVKFRDERNWKQFHNPKDLALSLVLESSEFMEHFQWKSPDEIEIILRDYKEEVSDELADVQKIVREELQDNKLGLDVLKESTNE